MRGRLLACYRVLTSCTNQLQPHTKWSIYCNISRSCTKSAVMAEPGFTSREQREAELFKLIAESLQERRADVPDTISFLSAGRANLDYEQIGEADGFLNYIFHVKERVSHTTGAGSDSSQNPVGRSVVVKWTRVMPRIAEQEKMDMKNIFGEDEHSVCKRNTEETQALKQVERIIPGSTPKVFWVDPKRYFFIMEYLAGFSTLRQLLNDRVVNEEVFRKIARMLATLHRTTHVSTLGAEEFAKLRETCKNDMYEQVVAHYYDVGFKKEKLLEMFSLTETREYSTHMQPLLPELFDNDEVEAVIARLKEAFTGERVCLTHSDTHAGAFMVRDAQPGGEADVRIIDLEISDVGNPAREIGYALGELTLFYYVYRGQGRGELADRLKSAVRAYIEDYLQHMGSACISDPTRFMQYLAGHTAQFGLFAISDVSQQYPQFAGLDKEEANCVSALLKLLKGMDKITTVEKFIEQAFAAV